MCVCIPLKAEATGKLVCVFTKNYTLQKFVYRLFDCD